MRSATHINNLPSDVLARILSLTSRNSDSHALKPKPLHVCAIVSDNAYRLDEETFSLGDPSSPVFTIAQLPLIKSWSTCQLLLSDWPCTSLERLQISYCDELKRLPDNFAESLPRIRELPENLLPALVRVNPRAASRLLLPCCLGRVALPADIGRLSNLHTLLLTESLQQRHLPCSLTEISSLTSLSLHQCGVEELPEGVGELSNLRDLHVSSCSRLTSPPVPASLTCLTALEALTLSNCASLTSVPTRWDGLTRLKQLKVATCGDLTRPDPLLPASLEALSWGSDRQAMVLPDVSRLTGLRELSLIRVAVAARGLGDAEELPFAVTFLSQLRSLHIDNAMNLQRLPADFGSALPQLRKLTLARVGELRELPASVTALQSLTSLEVRVAPKLPSLPRDIGSLSRLRELLLFRCTQLEHLPASFTQLACRNDLSILHCSIRSLCPNFSRLARLRTLELSGCARLQALPADLSELKALQLLDVEECDQLTDVDWSVLPWSRRQMLDLYVL
ncbi:unnamed protein product [Closterium sp. Yama58-4]|nr:unnamed protein product [Closterium sp. Yama58-4]